jgi:hypothetical protein
MAQLAQEILEFYLFLPGVRGTLGEVQIEQSSYLSLLNLMLYVLPSLSYGYTVK